MTGAAIPLGTVKTTPVKDQSPAQLYLVGQEDFVIPVVFPDYLIHIDGYEAEIFGRKITIPAQKAPYLGHAGVLIINGKSGLTKYYEYGRYGPDGKTRWGKIPDVTLRGGMITESSLKKALRAVSSEHGQSGRIAGVVLRGRYLTKHWLGSRRSTQRMPTPSAKHMISVTTTA